MTSKKTVRARLVFKPDMPYGLVHLDVVSTFNMTQRAYTDRQPDMLVEDENGKKYLIIKSLIAFISEVSVVDQKVEEVEKE